MSRHSVRIALCFALACANGAFGCDENDDDDDAPLEPTGPSGGPSGPAAPGSSQGSQTTQPKPDKPSDSSAEPEHVTIDSGPIAGTVVADKVRAFLGIPYAKPPVGALRFAAPEAPAKWTSRRDAKEFGGRCAQLESTVLQNAGSDSEDCLYLNVWTPLTAPAPTSKLPVMVWIHGGGNVNGSTSEPVPYLKSGVFYSGEHLAADNDVIVVSLNYRLGVFGFLAHDELATEGSPSGNQGLWDQLFALEWVKRNIASFGGDPKQVTIFGESAGSFDVCAHVASPKSRGLFQRAISQSGGCTTYQPTQVDGVAKANDLAQKLACDEGNVLDCLRDKSVAELLAITPAGGNFGPIVDGDFLPEQPRTLYDKGQIAKVPYILGSNTDEGTLFTGGQKIETREAFEAAVKQRSNAPIDEILKRYPLTDFDDDYGAAFARIVGDSALVCSTYDTALRNAAADADTYLYNFDIPSNAGNLGATHGAELVYVFGTSPNLSEAQSAASERIQDYWTQFATTGDPNGGDLLEWPLFAEDSDVRVNLALEDTLVRDFRAAQCDFWRSVYATRFPTE